MTVAPATRPRGWRQLFVRLPLQVGEIAAVIVALALGYLVIDRSDSIGTDMPPFVRSVDADRTAHLAYADVRVTGVTTASFLSSDDASTGDPVALAPAGVFLLVTVALTPTREPTFFNVWLDDGQGRIFRPSTKSGCDNSFDTQTGVTTYSVLCFEVPPGLLEQFRLEVSRGDDLNNRTRNDEVADLALGISAADGTRLATTTEGYDVVQASTSPPTLKPFQLTGTGDSSDDSSGAQS